ncbi:diacylglycerol kinase [Psychroserpens ponticola]|uniref:Diacylglycerol kinase family protein n=1 Tax=Psychroserpens ponticola TaxID=2932268 RepID=A0ABY7S0R7_9FLAO|nr:diacylglycerol kinase family protein [Psychroserpens ponticola]WCO02922.1 diacylglycerol kinase family protein [Psychroserpens ponticola]
MSKKDSFLVNRLKSVGHAYKGVVHLIKTESSIKIQVCIAIAVTITGFYFDISNTEWLIQIVFIGLVMSLEGMNTAFEHISDFVHPDTHEHIGRIKDIAAGAVLIAAVSAVIAALIIYIPKIF